MSVKDLLANQYKYPLPAQPPFFVYQWDTNAIPLSANTKVVPVSGIPDPAIYNIDVPIVQVSMISTGFQNSDIQLCGFQNYDAVAGTLDILVNTITDATTRFLIFISQSTE
jgi:hypothetical protein